MTERTELEAENNANQQATSDPNWKPLTPVERLELTIKRMGEEAVERSRAYDLEVGHLQERSLYYCKRMETAEAENARLRAELEVAIQNTGAFKAARGVLRIAELESQLQEANDKINWAYFNGVNSGLDASQWETYAQKLDETKQQLASCEAMRESVETAIAGLNNPYTHHDAETEGFYSDEEGQKPKPRKLTPAETITAMDGAITKLLADFDEVCGKLDAMETEQASITLDWKEATAMRDRYASDYAGAVAELVKLKEAATWFALFAVPSRYAMTASMDAGVKTWIPNENIWAIREALGWQDNQRAKGGEG